MISPTVVSLLKSMIQNARSKRDRVVAVRLAQAIEKIPPGHGARLVVCERVIARELENRAMHWLALTARIFRETRTQWTDRHVEEMTTILGEQLSYDVDGLIGAYQARLPDQAKESPRAGAFNASYEYSGTRLRHELALLALTQEAAHVPLSEQLSAPRYGAVRAAWTRANDLFASKPSDYKPVALDAIGAVEELARLLIASPTATLGAAIRELRKAGRVPAPILAGIEELWGWTSGEPGVRHGAAIDSPVDADDARYALSLAEGALRLLIARDLV